MLLLRGRLAHADDALRPGRRAPRVRRGPRARSARGRDRSRAVRRVPAVAIAGGGGARAAARDDHAARMVGAGADVQGASAGYGRARRGELRPARVSAPADGRHRDRPRTGRSGRGGSGLASRALARDRPALQPVVRGRARGAAAIAVGDAADPRVRRTQDVEVPRQHDRAERGPRHDPGSRSFVRDRSEEDPAGRPGPSGDLSDLRAARHLLA